MNRTWQKPARLGLATKLDEVVQRLRDAAPVLAEAHAKALEGMAQVVVARTDAGGQKEVGP
jgi:hypothetical protein